MPVQKTEPAFLAVAKQALRIEIEALEALEKGLGADFEKAVETVFSAAEKGGRLVVAGIGKSAIVAQKIAATLNSTGQPALFLHAADAIHGDLGMIQKNDVVLMISKSGSTPEIRALAPLVRSLGVFLIAMTAERGSFLAQNSDLVLWTPIKKEADPNGLAPTASTTAQMALGDALAVALIAKRGFSSSDFARNHPGGQLGKALFLTAGELASRHEKPRVRPDDGLRKVIFEISSKRLGAAVVEDEKGKILGIVTDGDLRRMLEKSFDFESILAKNIMTERPRTIFSHELAVAALEKMRSAAVSQLVVTDEKTGRFEGFVHLHDLAREGLF